MGVGSQGSSITVRHHQQRMSGVQNLLGHIVEAPLHHLAMPLDTSLRPVKVVSKRHGSGIIASRTYLESANTVVLLVSIAAATASVSLLLKC